MRLPSTISLPRSALKIETRTMIALFVVALAVWAFAGLSEEVMEGETAGFDRAILLWLRDPADPSMWRGPAWLETVMRDLTALGGFTVLGGLTLTVAGFLWMQARRADVALLLGSVLSGQLLSNTLKWVFDRPRPDLVPHATDVTSASFPSGHSLMATITWLTLAVMVARVQPDRRLRVYLIALAAVISLLVGISRVFLGVHWPSDVLGGWALGTGWALLCLVVANRVAPRRPRVTSAPPPRTAP